MNFVIARLKSKPLDGSLRDESSGTLNDNVIYPSVSFPFQSVLMSWWPNKLAQDKLPSHWTLSGSSHHLDVCLSIRFRRDLLSFPNDVSATEYGLRTIQAMHSLIGFSTRGFDGINMAWSEKRVLKPDATTTKNNEVWISNEIIFAVMIITYHSNNELDRVRRLD